MNISLPILIDYELYTTWEEAARENADGLLECRHLHGQHIIYRQSPATGLWAAWNYTASDHPADAWRLAVILILNDGNFSYTDIDMARHGLAKARAANNADEIAIYESELTLLTHDPA